MLSLLDLATWLWNVPKTLNCRFRAPTQNTSSLCLHHSCCSQCAVSSRAEFRHMVRELFRFLTWWRRFERPSARKAVSSCWGATCGIGSRCWWRSRRGSDIRGLVLRTLPILGLGARFSFCRREGHSSLLSLAKRNLCLSKLANIWRAMPPHYTHCTLYAHWALFDMVIAMRHRHGPILQTPLLTANRSHLKCRLYLCITLLSLHK